MSDMVEQVATGAALFASLIGALVAISQLTLQSRMQRRARALSEAIEHETAESRLTVLRELRVRATGRFISTLYVPSYYFIEPWLYISGITWGVVALARTDTTHGLGLAGAIALYTGLLWVPFRKSIRLYLERQRVAIQYARESPVAPSRLDLLDQMEGGTRAEFAIAIVASACFTSVALGLGLLSADANPIPALALVVCPLGAIWWPVEWLGKRTLKSSPRASKLTDS